MPPPLPITPISLRTNVSPRSDDVLSHEQQYRSGLEVIVVLLVLASLAVAYRVRSGDVGDQARRRINTGEGSEDDKMG